MALVPKNEVTRSIFSLPRLDASPSLVTSQHQQKQPILIIKECFLMAKCLSNVYHHWSFYFPLDFSCLSPKGWLCKAININATVVCEEMTLETK